MKKMIICLTSFFVIHTVANSQTTAIWVGGTPGRSTDWNSPTNWKEGNVPDEYCQVIIPSDRQYYPVIKSAVQDIDALLVAGDAKLMLDPGASLNVLGESGRLDGLTIYGTIINEGTLNAEMTRTFQAGMRGKIVGNGTCLIATNSNYNEIAQK